MLDFCVAIRTYNGEKYLSKILDALRAQVGLEDLTWEVLVVDNNSTDRTAGIVKDYQAQWPAENPLRYCLETVQGASFCRRRAIEEANAPLIGFLDDDNVPTPTWVKAAISFAKTHPQAAAFGGQIHGRFEVPPPPGFERIAGFIPIIEREESVCFTQGLYDRINMLPPGAGLVIRRQIWLDYVPEKLTLRGPIGSSLALKGEDIEALLYIKQSGAEIWFNADMHIDHYIPQGRLERDYLLDFFKGIGLSRIHTRSLTCPPWQRPFKLSLFALNDLRKIIGYLIRYRFRLRSDLIAACEFQLIFYSFLGIIQSFSRQLKSNSRAPIATKINASSAE